MLTIGRDHVARIETDRREVSIGRLVDELARVFPDDFALFEPGAARELAARAIDEGEEYGLSETGDCWRLLSLMVLLGSGFAHDPQLPWAGDILRRQGLDGHARMDLLYDEVSPHLATIAGPRGERYKRALVRARRLTMDALAGALSVPERSGVEAVLRRLHPEKHALLADEVLGGLVTTGAAFAARHGLDLPEGRILGAVFPFLLGAGVEADPAHRWLRLALADAGQGDPAPAERCRRLLAAAHARIERALGRETAGSPEV